MKVRRPLVLLSLGAALAVLVPAPALAEPDSDRSEVNEVHVARVEPLGTFGGTGYERLVGTVSGTVSADESVAGLDTVVDDGAYHYTSGFELIRPVRPGRRSEVVVEAENQGSPLMLRDLNSFDVPAGAPQDVTYSPGLGNGFLLNDGRSYARVQWQTGISPGVPESAQGVGQVIVRDFGRLLRDGELGDERSVLGVYRHRLLIGLSQSSWFVTSFVAEGFNNAGGRVYQGAYAQDGLGNQLALNAVAAADGGPQVAYVRPDGVPLTPDQVLRRPKTDPVFVDVATYTDYYRLRASVSRQAGSADGYHRYDWPGAHAPSRGPATANRAFNQLACNDGEVIPLSSHPW